MTWGILIGQLLVLVAAYLLWGYLKALPQRIHDEGVKKLEYGLNEQLEGVRAGLSREIELLKISQAELQTHKNEELIKLAEFFAEAMTDPRAFQNIEKNAKAQQKLKKNMFEMGMKLFFFASDDTLREFNQWRATAAEQATGLEPVEALRTYARLMLMIRRDVGHADTELTEDDYLRATIVDWDQYSLRTR